MHWRLDGPAHAAALGSTAIVGVYWILQRKQSKATLSALTPQIFGLMRINTFSSLALVLAPVPLTGRLAVLDLPLFNKTPLTDLSSIVLSAAGVAVSIWARNTLADNWDASPVIKRDHVLVQNGPYSLMRHPMYTGVLLIFLGAGLATARTRSLLFLSVLPFFVYTALAEEGLMRTTFSDEYSAYAARVKRFIPFVV